MVSSWNEPVINMEMLCEDIEKYFGSLKDQLKASAIDVRVEAVFDKGWRKEKRVYVS